MPNPFFLSFITMARHSKANIFSLQDDSSTCFILALPQGQGNCNGSSHCNCQSFLMQSSRFGGSSKIPRSCTLTLKSYSSHLTLSTAPTCTLGAIRLAGGETALEGRVELCLSGSWVSVCNSYSYTWNLNESTVVCQQLSGEQDPRKK